jgi:glycine/D-amino acid oxidase-like deaminating enzyme
MDAEVVVVGVGIVGASIALQLARRDVGDVLLVDAEGPAAGMSGRSFRQVRTPYSNEVTARPPSTSARCARRRRPGRCASPTGPGLAARSGGWAGGPATGVCRRRPAP